MLRQWLADLPVSAASHGVAALCFGVIALLLCSRWRSRLHALKFSAACAITACWAAYVAAFSLSPDLEWTEALRTAAWLAVLLMLSSDGRRRMLWLAGLAALSLAPLAASQWPSAAVALRLALSVAGMLLVEHLYRSTAQGARWGIKFACLGVGALFAYDFYLYSDALLFHRISPEIWGARGFVNTLSVPLLALAEARNPAWAQGLSLSRQIMFRSAALLGAALYLLAMSGSAWYLRYIGGAWGTMMQLACLFGAALLLACVLFSGAMRARLKVFIGKHFYQVRYDYRQEWMRFTRGLVEEGGALNERVIQAMAELVESPGGILWLRRDDGNFKPVAGWNMALQDGEIASDSDVCRFLEGRHWVIDLDEYRKNPQRYGQLALPAWLAAPDWWLVAPLMLEQSLYGFLCLSLPRTEVDLNWEVLDLLKIAGSQAASYLAHRESAENLAIARQFESMNRMSAFIVHDLKNLVSQLSLLLVNAERHKANPEFQADMLGTLAHSVERMKTLLHKLSRGDATEAAAPLQLDQLLSQVVSAHAALEPKPVLELRASGLTVMANWQRLERVIGHLIQNAVEATASDGKVCVRLLRNGSSAVIELSDTGQGMSAAFVRERLFRPFETTKANGMGIGMFESREYLREAGGRIDVNSVPGKGTTFRLVLPIHGQSAAAA